MGSDEHSLVSIEFNLGSLEFNLGSVEFNSGSVEFNLVSVEFDLVSVLTAGLAQCMCRQNCVVDVQEGHKTKRMSNGESVT